MKLASYLSSDGSPRTGVLIEALDGSWLADLAGGSSRMLWGARPRSDSRRLAERRLPDDMGTLLALGEAAMDDARRVHTFMTETVTTDGGPDRLLEAGILAPVGGVSYLPVVPRPGKIICAGMNYASHADEAADPGAGRPDRPGGFVKLASSLLGHGQGIAYPSETAQLDYEGELAIVIGRAALRVKPSEALSYVAGYTIMNDVSCRDIQFAEMKAGMLLLGKNAPRSTPLGPWLVTPDEGFDPHDRQLRVTVNGEVRQSGSTGDLIFGCEDLISYWSGTGLDAGDIIATGTPAGVGIFGEPPEQFLLRVGDLVEVTVSGIGTLQNQVVSPTP